VAAGRGTRLGAGRPKALVPLGRGGYEEPIVVHALRGVLRCRAITHVVVVAPPDPEGMRQLTAAVETAFPVGRADPSGERPCLSVVPGGAERSDSVALGLAALPPEVDVVLVHDAARALTPVEVFDRVVEAVRSGHAAVTPAVPVTDTIKQVAPPTPSDRTPGVVAPGAVSVETVLATIDRSSLRAVQTPQGFRRETLERAHAEVAHAVTDDCSMVEAAGGTVTVVPGSPRALKITTASDLAVAAAWFEEDDGAGTAYPAGPALVVLGGPPGVGKTTIARALCRRLGAAHLRVDTVEQGLVRGGLPEEDLVAQGYGATYAVAADQLAVGLPVVADMVNGVAEARLGWERVAQAAGARVVRVLVRCSDEEEHRRRVEGRTPDLEGHRLPGWEQVRTRELAPWPEAQVRLDTAVDSVEDAVARVEEALR
jgi:2-C-methyl-D-erythritol 4-phosphate cytidylyltransferase